MSANDETVFYPMNGFVLGTWLASALEADGRRTGLARMGATRRRCAPYGGLRGYVADPDEHLWEIA